LPVRTAIVSGGALCLVGAAAVAVALPLMRRYDSREHLAEADAASAAADAEAGAGAGEPDVDAAGETAGVSG
jgi:hypothetical protein